MNNVIKTLSLMIVFIIAMSHSSLEQLKFNGSNNMDKSIEQRNNLTVDRDLILAVLDPTNDFSAVVYKSNGLAKARNSRGDVIAEGKDGNDDSAVIQAAIDQFPNGGRIFIKNDDYFIDSTIILNSRTRLEFEPGATLIPDKNINLIQVKPASELSGGIFDVSNIEFTKSVILLNGSDKFGITNNALIEGARIKNLEYLPKPRGNAIWFMVPNASSGYIAGVKVKNIAISGAFKYGILLSRPKDSPSGWINGNSFNGIIGEGAEYFIYLDNMYDNGTDGNNFGEIQYESTNKSMCAITINGEYNSFNCLVWDWQIAAGKYAIVFLKNSTYNYLQKHTLEKVEDRGLNNIIDKLPGEK